MLIVHIFAMAVGKTAPLCVALYVAYNGYESLELWNVVFVHGTSICLDVHIFSSSVVQVSNRMRF
jgi:hypothetical protein